jgi:Protein of unknown function (DUF2568)
VLPLAAAAAWGVFVAPKRRVRRGAGLRYAVELIVFASATAALWAVDGSASALVFLAAALATGAATRALRAES